MARKLSDYIPGLKGNDPVVVDIALDLGDILDPNGNEILEFDSVASAVNHIRILNAATATNPAVKVVGDDTNIGLDLTSKGTGAVTLWAGDVARELAIFANVASAVNQLQFSPSATGSRVTIEGTGSDTDIGIALLPKGAGTVHVTDNFNMSFGTTTGTKLGTATTQKIAFYNSTPVVQAAGTDELLTSIKALGLIGAGATPITMVGDLTFGNALNIIAGTGTGTKIATATTQKIAFYNGTPVVQPSSTGAVATSDVGSTTTIHVNTTFTGGVGSSKYTLADVIGHLKTLGLIAS